MRRRMVAALCVLCAAGCGDNLGSSESGFRVVEVTPADGAVGFDVESAVVVRLSEAVDANSADAVALTGVAAGLAVEGDTITLTPVARLPFETELELTVSTALVSATGEPIAEAWSSRFRTRWRIWSEPEQIGPATLQVGASRFRPLVVGAPTGDAVAVWEDDAESAYRLSGARYAVATGAWIQDEEIASGGADFPLGAQLAADAAGNMLLVWRSVERIEHAWYNPENSAWYHGAPVYVGEAVLSAPVVALSPGGKGAALWSESGTRMVARLDGDVWSPAESLGAGETDSAAVAVDDDGNVTITWKRASGALSVQRSEGDGWGAVAPLWTPAEGTRADRPRIAALPGGRALAVWGVVRADGAEVHARVFDPGTGTWSDDDVIGTADTPNDTLPELAAAGDDVLVVWDDWNGGLDARWWRGGAWDDAVAVAGGDVHAPEHQVAVDAGGNAVTAYAMISASTWWSDRGWSAATVAPNVVTVPIAVTFAGPDPLAVWEHYTYDQAQGAPIQQGIRASFFR